MAGLSSNVDIGAKLASLAGAWEEFSVRDFARAVQFSLTGVGIDAVNRWRRAAPGLFDRPVKETLDGVRYEVDNALLNSIQTADQASARVFVKDRASTWMKFGFGEGHRAAGDVGIEAWFPNQDKVYIPVEDGLSRTQNIRPDAYGNYSGRAVKKLAGNSRPAIRATRRAIRSGACSRSRRASAIPQGWASASTPGRRGARRWSIASA